MKTPLTEDTVFSLQPDEEDAQGFIPFLMLFKMENIP